VHSILKYLENIVKHKVNLSSFFTQFHNNF